MSDEPLVDPYAARSGPGGDGGNGGGNGRSSRVAAVLGVVVLAQLGGLAFLSYKLTEADRALSDVTAESDDDVGATRKAAPSALPDSTPHVSAPPPVGARPATPPPPRTDLGAAEKKTIDIFRQASPAVVYITRINIRHSRFQMDAMAIPSGTGSGFVWDRKGHVVTNYHVIRGGSAAKVTLADQSSWDATLVGHAVEKDLAVLRIKAPANKLTALPVGTSSNLLVGQDVFAIGNPFGLDHTLSKGVISGLGREIKSVAGHPITGVVQTDAAINPGNSGGPLLDSAGRLIGVNTAIYSPSGASAGIGFAVPVDTVNRIVPQLIKHGRVVRPGLGIQIADEGVTRRVGVAGVLVLGVVDGSGADKAGLQPTLRDKSTGEIVLGDIIVGVDGKKVKGPTDLFRALDAKQVGDVVTVTVERGNKKLDLKVQLSALGGKK
jgi:S1-C subfamily serine protease